MALNDKEKEVTVKYLLDAADYIRKQDKMQSETKDTSKTINTETKKQSNSFKAMSLKTVAAFGAVVFAGKQLIGFLLKAATETERYTRAMLGLDAVATAMGEDGGSLQKTAQEIEDMTKGMVSAEQAAQGLKFLISSGFSTDEASEMSKALLNTGAFNRVVDDLGQAFVDSSKGIKTGSIELIENIGLTQKLSAVMKDAGISIKEGIDITNNAEQRQALFNVVMDEGTKFAGNLDIAVAGYAGTMAEAEIVTSKMIRIIGEKAQPVIAAFAKAWTTLLKPFVEKDAPKASEKLADLIAEIEELQSKTEPTAEDTKRLQEAMNEISILNPTLVEGYNEQGDAIVTVGTATKGLLEIKKAELRLDKLKLQDKEDIITKELEAKETERQAIKDTFEQRKKAEMQNRQWLAERYGTEDIESRKLFEKRMAQYDSEQAEATRTLDDTIERIEAEKDLTEAQINRINEVEKALSTSNVVELSGTPKKPKTSKTIDREGERKKRAIERTKEEKRLAKEYEAAMKEINESSEAIIAAESSEERKKRAEERIAEEKRLADEYKIATGEIEEERIEEEKLRLEEEKEQRAEEVNDIRNFIKTKKELRDKEAEDLKKIIKEESVAFKARAAAERGYKDAVLQASRDIVEGKTKSFGDYAAIVAKEIQLEMLAKIIPSTVGAIYETAKGLAAAAVGSPTAKTHFASAATFAKTAAAAGAGAVATGSFVSAVTGGGDESSAAEIPTGSDEEELVDIKMEEIEEPEFVYITEEDKQRLRFGLVDDLNEALEEGKALKVVKT